MIDATHDPGLTSWVESAQGHTEFPVQNLPLGVFRPGDAPPRIGTAIGDFILDLPAAAAAGLLPAHLAPLLGQPTLNALLGDTAARRALRQNVSALLTQTKQKAEVEKLLHRAADCTLGMPVTVGNYTDFYTGIHHALNVGRQFRPDNPLMPNYKHIPVGYHGRASSVRPSGVPVRRPNGQRKAPQDANPTFGRCERLDYELELAVWVGAGNALGEPVPIAEAASHIGGIGLLNDWSARDIQAWEYVPLGPFQGKNFHSSVSPWIVTAEALAPYRRAQAARPAGDPTPLPYLMDETDQRLGAFAIEAEASILTPTMRERGMAPHVLAHTGTDAMYWTIGQMIAHHTVGGCNLEPGDLLGTGTLSRPSPDGLGSLIEITLNGAQPMTLPSGETRTFLEDGDEIVLTAHAVAAGYATIGFGECRARILPAR